MPNQILRQQTRLNIRNNRLVLNNTGIDCCCTNTQAIRFRECCTGSPSIWVLADILTQYITAIRYGGRCYSRTTETVLVSDLEKRGIDWLQTLDGDTIPLFGNCGTLVDSGHCPPCEPPTDECCYRVNRAACRVIAATGQPYDSPECCVLGSGYQLTRTETVSFIRFGAGYQRRTDVLCDPYIFDTAAPLEQYNETHTTIGTAVCPSQSFVGSQTYSKRGVRWVNDGFDVFGSNVIPRNPRYINTDADWTRQDVFDVQPDRSPLGTFIGFPLPYLYLPERNPDPNMPPLLSICDGETSVRQDLNNDGNNELEFDARVTGAFSCTSGRVEYVSTERTLFCSDLDNRPFYVTERWRQTIEWQIRNIQRDRCTIAECNELGRMPDENALIGTRTNPIAQRETRCQSCREQPGL